MTQTTSFLDNILLFVQMLRAAGMPVGATQARDFARALTLVDIGEREQVYFTARALLVTDQSQLRLFTTLFNQFWRQQPPRAGAGQKAPQAPRHKRPDRPGLAAYMAFKAKPTDPEIDLLDKAGTFSPHELLARKSFAAMTDEELVAVKRLLSRLRWRASWRRTRRRVPAGRGDQVHLRRVLRSAAKYGGVPLRLSWQRRKIKQRPVILLADISGSMEKYSRLVLQFFYSISHGLPTVESFVFGTRLTRITNQLRLKNIDRAISEAAADVADLSGGTRIGASLQAFNGTWSRRVLRRGALVIVVSDGWERTGTALLAREMRYLQGRCHRLIWLNPLAGKVGYQPLVEGMRAALPFIDDFLPVHNLQSLQQLAAHLASLGSRRGGRAGALGRRAPVTP